MKKIIICFAAIILTTMVTSNVQAGSVGTLVDFQSGQPAYASEVNSNFSTLKAAINDNDTRLNTNESNISNLTSGYVSVNATIAVPQNSSHETGFSSGAGFIGRKSLEASGGEWLSAPVNLPDGAIITEIKYVCVDVDATYDSQMVLNRSDGEWWGPLSTSGITGIQSVSATLSTGDRVIDNANYSYFVSMEIRGGTNITPVTAIVGFQF